MDAKRRDELLVILRDRFLANARRHEGLEWSTVRDRLGAHPGKLSSLDEMERTGGEPDVVGHDRDSGACLFFDCSAETPAGRRSLCYDRAALDSRKAHKPAGDVVGMAAAMGVDLLTEEQYRYLQGLGEFDAKTSSWVLTPSPIREKGGALFMDRRYGEVFTYHNGASSYYDARGFRSSLLV